MTPGVEGTLWLVAVPAVVLGALILSMEAAHRAASGRETPSSGPAQSAVAGVAFSLLALLLAFAYADASTRLETHRALAVQEANAIEDVWHRADILDEVERGAVRELLRRYTDERILAQDALPDERQFEIRRLRAEELHEELWVRVVSAVSVSRFPDAQILLLPPVLALSDVATLRTVAVGAHASTSVLVALFLLACVGAVLVGMATATGGRRHWPIRLVFAVGVAAAIDVVVDMEYPRNGVDQAAKTDATLVAVRRSMD